MGAAQTDDDLPALDNEQLDSLLDESEPVSEQHEDTPAEYNEPPAEEESQAPQNPAYLSWLGPVGSPQADNGHVHETLEQAPESGAPEQAPPADVVEQPISDSPSPFERLYSANPELFDAMTVGEFVPHARQLRRLEDAAQQIKDSAEEIKNKIAELEAERQNLLDQADGKQREADSFLERYKYQASENPDIEQAP